MPYWENHTLIENELVKRCSICLEWFPCTDEFFYKNKLNGIDGLYPYCIECTKMKSSKWIRDNPEKHKEHMKKEDAKQSSKDRQNTWALIRRENGAYKEWQQSESGKNSSKKMRIKRETTKKHKITKEELNILYSYCNSECMYCGFSEVENQQRYNQKLAKDHAINNGSNGIENCVLACKSCSSSKHAKDWIEWYTPDNPVYSTTRKEKIEEWLNGFK